MPRTAFQARGGEERTLTSQTDFTTESEAFGMKHLVLAGLELAREKAERWNVTGAVPNPPTTLGHPDPFSLVPEDWAWWLRNFRAHQDCIGWPATATGE